MPDDQPTKPSLIIISSPSGAGKSTICKMLLERNGNIKLSVSATTRKSRPMEIHGKDYFFTSKEDFQDMVDDNSFLEHAKVFDHSYGTPKQEVLNQLTLHNNVLFDIDWQGARQIISRFPKEQIISFFILPPSIKELHIRLQNRAQDSEEIVLRRMQKAKDEMSHFNEYDYVIINKDLEETYNTIHNLIFSKSSKDINRESISLFVKKLLLENL